jgi:hypothetical protein
LNRAPTHSGTPPARPTAGTALPLRFFPALAFLELAGAAGILIGLWLEPLGVAAAVGLVAYFLGALTGHLRVPDTKNLAMSLPALVLSVAALVLRLVTL